MQQLTHNLETGLYHAEYRVAAYAQDLTLALLGGQDMQPRRHGAELPEEGGYPPLPVALAMGVPL